MARKTQKVSDRMKALLKKSGSRDPREAMAAAAQLAKALELPLRQGILRGDIIGGIFEPVNFEPGASIEFPLDFLAPGTEKDFVAYTVPNHGYIPQRHVDGDYVMVPTYDVGSSIDWLLKYSRDARWDVVGRAMAVLEGSFVRKANGDAWHTLLAAANGRGLVVFDGNAATGMFTKRLVALMKTVIRRQAGGNSTSVNQGRLTDLYLSPEALEDIRTWDLSQVDDFTRREIFMAEDNGPTGEYSITRIFGVNIHDIDELGVGQEYQNYYVTTLNNGSATAMPSGKQEIVLGLDLAHSDSFVMPIRADVEVFEDESLHRQRRAGFYGYGEHGFAVLDSRRVLLGSL
jgi:hypothetical protein